MILYQGQFKDVWGKHIYTIEIHNDKRDSGTTMELALGADACTVTHDSVDYDFVPLHPSKCAIQVVTSAPKDLLRSLRDDRPLAVRLLVKCDGRPYWGGYYDAEAGASAPYYKGGKYTVELRFGDILPLRRVRVGQLGFVLNSEALSYCIGGLGVSIEDRITGTVESQGYDLGTKNTSTAGVYRQPGKTVSGSRRKSGGAVPKIGAPEPVAPVSSTWGACYTGTGSLDETASAYDLLALVIGSWGLTLTQRAGHWALYDRVPTVSTPELDMLGSGTEYGARRITRATYKCSMEPKKKESKGCALYVSGGDVERAGAVYPPEKLVHTFTETNAKAFCYDDRGQLLTGALIRDGLNNEKAGDNRYPYVSMTSLPLYDIMTPLEVRVKALLVVLNEKQRGQSGYVDTSRDGSAFGGMNNKGLTFCEYRLSLFKVDAETESRTLIESRDKHFIREAEDSEGAPLVDLKPELFDLSRVQGLKLGDKICVVLDLGYTGLTATYGKNNLFAVSELAITQGGAKDNKGVSSVAFVEGGTHGVVEDVSITRDAGQGRLLTACSLLTSTAEKRLRHGVWNGKGSMIEIDEALLSRAMQWSAPDRKALQIDALTPDIPVAIQLHGGTYWVQESECRLHKGTSSLTIVERKAPLKWTFRGRLTDDTINAIGLQQATDRVRAKELFTFKGAWGQGAYEAYSEVIYGGALYRTTEKTSNQPTELPWYNAGVVDGDDLEVHIEQSQTVWDTADSEWTATLTASVWSRGAEVTKGLAIKSWRWGQRGGVRDDDWSKAHASTGATVKVTKSDIGGAEGSEPTEDRVVTYTAEAIL